MRRRYTLAVLRVPDVSTGEKGMGVMLSTMRAWGATPNRLVVQAYAWLMLGFCLVGCSERPSEPLATVPFDVSRKEQSVSIPLTVTPENADLELVYILGVFLWNPDKDPRLSDFRTYPPRQRLYLKVRVWKLANGRSVPLVVNDGDFDFDIKTRRFSFKPSMSERATDIAYVSASGRVGDVIHMESVHFRFPSYGQYRVDVETVGDTPLLHATPSWLTVQRDFPHGK